MICRGARAQVLKEMKNLFWEACFSHQRERLKVPNTFHIGYIIGGSQTENKNFAPHHRSMVLRLLSLFSIHIRRSLFIYLRVFSLFVVFAIWDWASLLPPHSRAMTSE